MPKTLFSKSTFEIDLWTFSRATPMDNSYDVDTDEEQAVDDPNSREASPDLLTHDERDSGKGWVIICSFESIYSWIIFHTINLKKGEGVRSRLKVCLLFISPKLKKKNSDLLQFTVKYCW